MKATIFICTALLLTLPGCGDGDDSEAMGGDYTGSQGSNPSNPGNPGNRGGSTGTPSNTQDAASWTQRFAGKHLYVYQSSSSLSGGVSGSASVSGGVTMDVQVGIHNTGNDRIGISFGDMRFAEGLSLGNAAAGWSAGNFQVQLSKLDNALDRLNTTRAKFGAVQNRLTNALNNLEVYTENLQAAESQIRDADFAFETAEMAKFQIMQQAGTAVLAQANQINQGAVRLLG